MQPRACAANAAGRPAVVLQLLSLLLQAGCPPSRSGGGRRHPARQACACDATSSRNGAAAWTAWPAWRPLPPPPATAPCCPWVQGHGRGRGHAQQQQ